MSLTAQRREEEKEQRKVEIIDAAERVFRRKGADKATIRDIAQEARLSRGLIYFYFKDKDAVDQAIAQRSIEMLRDLFRSAAERHESGIGKIRAIGEAYINFYRTRPFYHEQFIRFEAKDLEDEDDAASARYLSCGQDVLSIMASAIKQGVQDGSIRADIGDPRGTAVALWGMTHGVLQLGAMKAEMLKDEMDLDIDTLAAHTIDMIGRALSP